MAEIRHFEMSDLRGKLDQQVDMAKYTSWRVGGLADCTYRPADLEDLQVFLRNLPVDEPLFVLGLGSNVLVRDGGLRGTVLLMHSALNVLRMENDEIVYIEAGVPGAKLARFATRQNFAGAAFFAGIPGTLGGMLAMNAGCYGSETWEKVLKVMTVNRQGVLHMRTPEEYEIGYRHVAALDHEVLGSKENIGFALTDVKDGLTREIFVAAWLRFTKGGGELSGEEIKTLLKKRIASQPLNLPNAGSIFRNPAGDHAARLIEQCGLKGKRIGGAQVSIKHANFIVNAGGSSATDIESLIEEVQSTVEHRTGIRLHREVRIIGENKA